MRDWVDQPVTITLAPLLTGEFVVLLQLLLLIPLFEIVRAAVSAD
jgi:hypothetical protein